METPSAGPSVLSTEPVRSESPPERGDAEAVAFLARELLPVLSAHASRPLRDGLRRAVRERRLAPLAELSGRHRHELLVAIEQVSGTRHRPSPAVLVRLTSVVSSIPPARELVETTTARPAR
jgi:hypothetical protein